MRSAKRITARMMCSIMITATPSCVEPEQDSQDVVDLGAGEAGHGLVGDQQGRPRGERAGELELAQVDLGQIGGPRVRPAGEPDHVQDRDRLGPQIPAMAAGDLPRTRAARSRFSSTVRLRNGRGIWKLRIMPSRTRRCAESRVMSRPLKTIRPPSAAQHPRHAVDQRRLAGAVRADQARAARARTRCRLTASSAVKPPNRLVRAQDLQDRLSHGPAAFATGPGSGRRCPGVPP